MKNLMPMWCLNQGPDWAYERALTARDALGVSQGSIENGDWHAVKSPFSESDHELLLTCLTAGLCTKAALDAFRQVPPDAR